MNDNRQLRVCQLRSLLRHRKVKSVVDGVNTRTGGKVTHNDGRSAGLIGHRLPTDWTRSVRASSRRKAKLGDFFPKFLSLFSLSFSSHLLPRFSLSFRSRELEINQILVAFSRCHYLSLVPILTWPFVSECSTMSVGQEMSSRKTWNKREE